MTRRQRSLTLTVKISQRDNRALSSAEFIKIRSAAMLDKKYWTNIIIRKEIVKGVWRMPRLSEAKKDAVSCEKLRGSAHTNWSADVRMGQPGMLKTCHSNLLESKPGELKHLSTRRKRNRRDSVSSGERKRISPKVFIYLKECSGKNGHRGW